MASVALPVLLHGAGAAVWRREARQRDGPLRLAKALEVNVRRRRGRRGRRRSFWDSLTSAQRAHDAIPLQRVPLALQALGHRASPAANIRKTPDDGEQQKLRFAHPPLALGRRRGTVGGGKGARRQGVGVESRMGRRTMASSLVLHNKIYQTSMHPARSTRRADAGARIFHCKKAMHLARSATPRRCKGPVNPRPITPTS